ncbi:alpha/beta hydrolase [Methyloversatilis discipulorum]|uniref:alpha/beta hydrolase n=1 Tax=Methyloversatilis discipulorum TaxID=1119528 RepID=UPI00045E65AC|nr:alpha/beta hydrolase [Methyloversatilis discipulorum]
MNLLYPDAHGTAAPHVRNIDIAGPHGRLPLRIYQPRSDTLLPLVIYLHGGGFVGGSLDDADVPARHIAATLPAVVVSVDYALAPAHPFPAAPEDAYAATLWAADNAATLGADAQRIAVAGDDAGGNLAASLALIARDRQDVHIAVQVLIGPMLDPSMTRTGDAARLQSDLSAEDCADCYRQYLPQLSQRLHPYAAPLESCRQAGLPAAYIATAGRDLLHCEAEKYAAALIAAGVHTQVERFAGITHAALLAHPPLLDGVVQFLRCRLGRTQAGHNDAQHAV